MTSPDFDEEELAFLNRARRGLDPTAAERARVLGQMLPMLPAATAASGAASLSRTALAMTVGASLAIGGGAGYWLGFGASHAAPPPTPPALVAPPLPPPLPPPLEPEGAPEAPSEPMAEARSGAPRSPVRNRALPPPVPDAPPPAASSGLDEEVRQLRRIERAVREGNPRLALVLLEDLQRAIPQGQLLEERRAAAIMANCQLAVDGATEAARAFTTAHAGSAYVARVIDICRLDATNDERIPGPAGTDVPRKGRP